LAICKRLAELMGGDVSVQSIEGLGSIFSFTFVARTDSSWRSQQRPDISVLVGKRVLVVDDNDTNRRILAASARDWAMEVIETGDPELALRWIQRGDHFDCAVLDYFMPGLDGVALAAKIRAHKPTEHMPLMLLSSVRRTQRSLPEFDIVMTKPVRRAALLDAYLELLGATTASGGTVPTPGPARRESNLRILLAEDNVVNQKVAARMLDSLGYAARVVENGADALEAVETERFDLILMDVHMPVMDGLEATRRIRNLPEQMQPRIYAMTASVLDSERQECLDAGMDRHIAKPVRKPELEAALEELERQISKPAPAPAEPTPEPAPAAAHGAIELDPEVLGTLREDMGDDGVVELIDAVTSGADAACSTLRNALADSDFTLLKRQAHTMKSNCAMFGALALSDDCQRLEKLAAGGETTAAAPLVALVDEDYMRMSALLTEMRPTYADAAAEIGSRTS
jgi:CheY-like chemotaxis protein/HPt (histidine-containing phosphotransfer) domain-containing protein